MSRVPEPRVGFIGLGDQGAPMAQAIASAGFELHAWARRPQSFDGLAGVAFVHQESPQCLAAIVDILALCLRDDHDIWDFLEQHQLTEMLRPGSIVVNHGTGDPAENERIGAFLAKSDIAYVDAPVSGGRPGAVARTLTTLVGGDIETFQRCRPVFESFSRKVVHTGPLGTGQLTKLLNNTITMTNLKNAVDVFGLAKQLGLDIPNLYDVIVVSSGGSAVLRSIGQFDSEVVGHIQGLMRKDIEHFADAIRGKGLDPTVLRDRGFGGAEGVGDLVRWIAKSR
jgi:3-hydroxyisobutyrate dehydrogenase-like beta-hydroxyacid dehydrogenase